ncbi:MAG: PHP domain-containing protein [Dehalococcoidia bacterium]|nr:PHP domain-containing protein [Dehalococcoidia bacterium]
MDPIAALKRIAFLLEMENAPAYRAKAFRTAARTISGLPAGELEERVRTGRLRSLPGIGEVTASAITEALAGQTPAYLARLEEAHAAASARNGEAEVILRALRGDCHVHSDWSDGASPIAEMAETARDLGHEYMVLTDHSPRLTVARGLSAERLREQIDVVAEFNRTLAPFRILTGIECDILADGSLDQEEELLERLDIVVGSVHSKLRMPSPQMTPRLVRAIENPHLDILGHCTGRILAGRGRPESEFDAEQVFAACAANGKAVEINSRPERLDPPMRLLRMALDAGCFFVIDSDAHAPGQLGWLPKGAERAAEAGVPVERIVNTRGAGELLAWAGS